MNQSQEQVGKQSNKKKLNKNKAGDPEEAEIID
jgi:hypothetical protein